VQLDAEQLIALQPGERPGTIQDSPQIKFIDVWEESGPLMKMARSTGICGNGGVLGLSLYLNQVLSGQGSTGGNPQQETVNSHPIFSGMFFFPTASWGVDVYADC